MLHGKHDDDLNCFEPNESLFNSLQKSFVCFCREGSHFITGNSFDAALEIHINFIQNERKCLSTKVIHLELISSLFSNSFLQALRRFIFRRGKPSKMLSHNGTNFVGAQLELRNFLKSKRLRMTLLHSLCLY